MTKQKNIKPTLLGGAFVVANAVLAAPAYAAMPWMSPFNKFKDSITGETGAVLVVLGIAMGTVAFLMGDSGGAFKTGLRVSSAGAILIGATSLASTMFGI